MANIARFHRKKTPRKKDTEILGFDAHERDTLGILTTFIRLGESLDRSHTALVKHVGFSRIEKNSVILDVVTRGDCQLEIWGVEAEKKAFEKIFQRNWC